MRYFRDIILSGDAGWLAAEVRRLLEISVNPDDFMERCLIHLKDTERKSGYDIGNDGRGEKMWSEDTWRSWFKARVIDAGYYAHGSKSAIPDFRTCILHIGFISIIETDEQLIRLKRADDGLKSAAPARSKISSTAEFISPVDAVAARVAPTITVNAKGDL
jgi:hypothetical protein